MRNSSNSQVDNMVTLHLLPYGEIEELTSVGRIRKLLNLAKEDKIVVLQGKLKKDEEMELIKATMEEINHEFRGIELAVIEPGESKHHHPGLKNRLVNYFMANRLALTVIGPSNIVKDIKKDPSRIELITKSQEKKKK
jgi:hypothetical protein